MNIRTRRLKRDYEKILAELGSSEFAAIKIIAGDPPNHYQVTYNVNGLMWNETKSTADPISQHIVDIQLPPDYPKQAPRCVMRTPIWHPNIGDYVCIGDYWSAGVTLVDIIAHIGNMIQYKSYNLSSPVNKAAALWAQRNLKSFPVGNRTILLAENEYNTTTTIEISSSSDEPEIFLGPIRERN